AAPLLHASGGVARLQAEQAIALLVGVEHPVAPALVLAGRWEERRVGGGGGVPLPPGRCDKSLVSTHRQRAVQVEASGADTSVGVIGRGVAAELELAGRRAAVVWSGVDVVALLEDAVRGILIEDAVAAPLLDARGGVAGLGAQQAVALLVGVEHAVAAALVLAG